jgi:hypothetical protein
MTPGGSCTKSTKINKNRVFEDIGSERENRQNTSTWYYKVGVALTLKKSISEY